MMQKKGQGQQFNWLFIAVAGTVILVFFAVFTFKYIEIKKTEDNVAVSRSLGQTITALLSHGGIDYSVTSENKEEGGFRVGIMALIENECGCLEGDCSNIITVEGDAYSRQELEQVVFMPSSVRTNAFEAWISPWDYPFYVSSFIYLFEPGRKIYLVSDGGKFAEDVRDELERLNLDFSVEFVSKGKFKGEGVEEWDRVVFFTREKPSFSPGLWVKAPSGNSDAGEAVFLDSGEKVRYVGMPLLFGAIFSDSAGSYNCNYEIAKKRFADVSAVYYGKAGIMRGLAGDSECSSDLVLFMENVKKMELGRENAFGFKENLENLNDLISGRDCGYVF